MSADEPIRPDLTDEGSGDEHLEWRLSALLDGELSVTEEMIAREHLTGCDLCQDEFAEVMAARALVRGLGSVEPPKGSIERTMARVQRRYQTRLGLFGLLGIALVWILVLFLLSGINPPAADLPPLESLESRHRSAILGPEDSSGVFDAQPLSDAQVAALAPPFVLPASLGEGLDRVAVYEYQFDEVLHGVYRGEDGAGPVVSLFEQEGELQVDDLPAGSVRREVDGRVAWVVDRPELQVVVLPGDDAVFTLVGASPVVDLVADVPEPRDYTFGDRLRLSAEGLLRRLGID